MKFDGEFDNKQLEWATEIWREAFSHDPESLIQAKQILRYWRTEMKSELRTLQRSSERYQLVKKREEQLEGAILDLHEAWMTQLSARKHGG